LSIGRHLDCTGQEGVRVVPEVVVNVHSTGGVPTQYDAGLVTTESY
jgi:hypothetical protein